MGAWGRSKPQLLDLVTTCCDGTSVATPCVWKTPQIAAQHMDYIKGLLSDKGRNPDDFTFGICCPVLLHEEKSVIDEALENNLIRWLAAVFGRVDPKEWEDDGLQSMWPEGWNYFMKLVPMQEDPAFVMEALSKTTRAHSEFSTFHGTPAEVAEMLQQYVAVGVDWVQVVDYLPLTQTLEEGAKSLNRSIEVCRHLKRM